MALISLTFYYGPYEAHGIIRHKTKRLHGLIECLTKEGYEIELVPTAHLNRLTIDMCGREIASCDIRHLLFNLPCEEDVVCKRLMRVIREHYEIFYDPKNVRKFVSIKKGMRWLEVMKTHTTIDLLSDDVELFYEVGNALDADKQKLLDENARAHSSRELKRLEIMGEEGESVYQSPKEFLNFDITVQQQDSNSRFQEPDEDTLCFDRTTLSFDSSSYLMVCSGPCGKLPSDKSTDASLSSEELMTECTMFTDTYDDTRQKDTNDLTYDDTRQKDTNDSTNLIESERNNLSNIEKKFSRASKTDFPIDVTENTITDVSSDPFKSLVDIVPIEVTKSDASEFFKVTNTEALKNNETGNVDTIEPLFVKPELINIDQTNNDIVNMNTFPQIIMSAPINNDDGNNENASTKNADDNDINIEKLVLVESEVF